MSVDVFCVQLPELLKPPFFGISEYFYAFRYLLFCRLKTLTLNFDIFCCLCSKNFPKQSNLICQYCPHSHFFFNLERNEPSELPDHTFMIG